MKKQQIDRSFVSLDEGQLHLRMLEGDGNITPIVLLHASPASSWFMQGLMRELADAGFRGSIIAPDTLGNGDVHELFSTNLHIIRLNEKPMEGKVQEMIL